MKIVLQLDREDINKLISTLVIHRTPEAKELADKLVAQIVAQSDGQFFQCERCFDAESR